MRCSLRMTCENHGVDRPNPHLTRALPSVSYIMPVLNEEEYIEPAVASVLGQEYEGAQELILALGPSTDSTSAIAHSLAKNDSRIRLVDNPKKNIPIALNLAIAASNHPVIIRVDAHSSLSPNYTRDAIDSLIQQ